MPNEDREKKGLAAKIAQGALTGGGFLIGSAPGAAAGAAAGEALFQGSRARKEAKGRAVNPVRQSREMLSADVEALRTDPASLGMTEAERQAQIAEATQQAGQMQQAQQAQLARTALGAQDFQAGAFQAASEQIAGGTEQAAAKAAANAANLNQRIIESESARIRSELDAERARVKENTRFWTQWGIDTAAGLVGAAMGLPGVNLTPGASPPAPPTAPTGPAPTAQQPIDFQGDAPSLASGMGYQGGF